MALQSSVDTYKTQAKILDKSVLSKPVLRLCSVFFWFHN